nr:hypothetical protein [Tanacetum cinerariifolium]
RTINWGLWYLKDTAMALTANADADHAGCQETQRMPLHSAAIMFSTQDTMADMNIPALMLLLNKLMLSHHQPGRMIKFCRQEIGCPLARVTMYSMYKNLRGILSSQLLFRTPCALTHLLGCIAVSWMSNGLTSIITPTNDNNPFVAPSSSDIVIEYVNTLGYPSTLRNASAMSVNVLYQQWRAILSMINMCLAGSLQLPPPFHQSTCSSSGIRQYDKKAGNYRCQLDEQWFVLTKDTLREALQITPINNNQPFIAPPSSDALINFVIELGYPKLVRNVSNVVTNDMFQPWRALLTIINLCLTGKTSRFERPRAPVLQILWGIVKQANIDYAERIWEEFVQSIHTFTEDKRNLRHKFYSRPDSPLHLPNEEPVFRYLKFSAKGTKREVFGMPIPGSLITADIQAAFYYQEYLENVAKYRRKPKSTAPKAPPRPAVSTPVTSTQPAPTSAPAKPQEKKRKQATETSNKPPKAKKSKYGVIGKKSSLKFVAALEAEDVPVMEPQVAAEDTDLQKALEENMKTAYALPRGSLPPVAIREPESGKYQPFPEVPGKGKAKVTEEQVAHDLLSLQNPKRKSPVDQYIFQRGVSKPTGSSGQDESPYDVLGQSDSEEELEKVVFRADEGGQSKGQARPDPRAQAEGQTGSDAGAQDEDAKLALIDSETESDDKVAKINIGDQDEGQARPNLDLEVTDASHLQNPEQLDEEFTTTAYPNVQENLKLLSKDPFFVKKQQEEEPGKTNAEAEEILQQRMFKDKSYKAHEDHKNLYDALEKSLERDYSDQLLSDPEEARQKKRKRRDFPPPPPPLATGTSGSTQQQGCKAPSSSNSAASVPQSMAWTTSDTRYKLVHLSDDEDYRNDHLPTADSRKGWWKPLPTKERPATPKPTWTIPSSNVLDVENNWATVMASTYVTPAENSLLAKTRDMMNFLNWYSLPDGGVSRPLPLGGPPGHVTIQSQFFFNKELKCLRHGSKGSSPALLISKMKAASYPDFGLELLVPKQMWIEDVCTYDISAKYGISHWCFNRQKFYIDRYDSSSRRKEVRSRIRILSVVRIKAYSRYGYDYLSKIVLRRADLQEHMIAEKDFKNLHPSDFEHMNLLLLQGHLNHLPGSDKKVDFYCCRAMDPKLSDSTASYEFKHDYTIVESPRAVVFPVNNNKRKIMRFNEIYMSSDDTLTRILEALAYRVKEFMIKRLNLELEDLPRDNLLYSVEVLSSDACYYDPEKCEHVGPKVTTSHGGNTSQQG